MAVKQISIERVSLVTARSFEEVLRHLTSAVGRPDMAAFGKAAIAATTYAELEEVVNKAVGPSGLMEFIRFDLGAIHQKKRGGAPRSLRLVLGNPLIMVKMLEQVPDAGSYAPVTILIDERPDGVHISYDRMASFLRPYENQSALKVAQELDSKVEALLTAASQ